MSFEPREQSLLAAGLALLAFDALGRLDRGETERSAAERIIGQARELQSELEAATFGEQHG